MGICAFAGCFQLKEVRLPASLRDLGWNCFAPFLEEHGPYRGERALHLIFGGVPGRVVSQYLPQAAKVTILSGAPWMACAEMVKNLNLERDIELIADRFPLRQLPLSIQKPILRTWVIRLERGEAIPEDARPILLDGLKARKSAIWRSGVRSLRHLLLDEGLLSLQNVQTFLEEAQQEGDSELVVQLLEYEHRHFPPEEVERRERRRRQRALRNLPSFEEENPDGA